MLKRINYTDRRRIPRSQIAVKVDPIDPASFTIDLPADLIGAPQTEVAYVDITSAGSSEVLRHQLPWSLAGLSRGPYPLGRIPWKKAIFDVKVVEKVGSSPGRILRRASHIRAVGTGSDTNEGASHELLTTIREPLGERVWMLRFGEPVTLVINDALAMTEEQFVANPAFASLVFPEICRQALDWAVVSEGISPADVTSDDTSAAALWGEFARQAAPGAECPVPPVGGWTPHNRDELDDWIDEVVGCLCRQHALCSSLVSTPPEAFT
jgi:hypothetical protein